MLPVLDSLDNYKILSERMNVLTIYLPCRKIGIASDLSIVKTAVLYYKKEYIFFLLFIVLKFCEYMYV